MTPREKSAVRIFLDRINQQFGDQIKQIQLFGSKARGDSEPDSDIDILLIMEIENWPLRDAISLIASRVSLEYDVLIEPRVIGKERWDNMAGFSLYENILREGILLSAG